MSADTNSPDRDSRSPWSGAVLPCPQCGEGIPEFAVACPYCGSRFQVTRTGYCSQCRAVATATTAGTCEKCGAEMMDVKVERVPTADRPAAVVNEPVKFDVILTEAGRRQIAVTKLVGTLTGLGVDEAMELVENTPRPVKQAMTKAEADDVRRQLEEAGAAVEVRAEGEAVPSEAPPKPQPSATRSPEPATSPGDVPQSMATAPLRSVETAYTPSGAGFAEGMVPSRVQQTGHGLLELGSMGIILLVALQLYEAARTGLSSGPFGDGVFAATRGAEARGLGWGFAALAIVTMILASGLTLLPRKGLGFRAGGYAMAGIGILGALVTLTQGWGLPALVLFLALCMVGIFFVQKGMSSFRKELTARPGGKTLFRKRWLAVRFGIIAGLWLLGLVGYVLLLVLGGGWTVRTGGYIGAVLLVLGLLGAVALLGGSRGRPTMWMGPDGHVYEEEPS